MNWVSKNHKRVLQLILSTGLLLLLSSIDYRFSQRCYSYRLPFFTRLLLGQGCNQLAFSHLYFGTFFWNTYIVVFHIERKRLWENSKHLRFHKKKVFKSSEFFHFMSEKSVKKLSNENQTQSYKPRTGLIVDGSRRQGQNRKHKSVIVVYYKPTKLCSLPDLKKRAKKLSNETWYPPLVMQVIDLGDCGATQCGENEGPKSALVYKIQIHRN